MTDTPATAVASPAQRVLDSIAAVVIAIAAIALVGLVLVQSWQVFTRYMLATPALMRRRVASLAEAFLD